MIGLEADTDPSQERNMNRLITTATLVLVAIGTSALAQGKAI